MNPLLTLVLRVVISKELNLFNKMSSFRNFGHDGPEKFKDLGINAKNSEFHAGMGLINLNHIVKIINKRKILSERYDYNLKKLNAKKPLWHKNSNQNYHYYPLIFHSNGLLLKAIDLLESNNIYGRRYFYPVLSNALPYVKSIDLEVADNISERIFCLPLYYDLSIKQVDFICNLLTSIK